MFFYPVKLKVRKIAHFEKFTIFLFSIQEQEIEFRHFSLLTNSFHRRIVQVGKNIIVGFDINLWQEFMDRLFITLVDKTRIRVLKV